MKYTKSQTHRILLSLGTIAVGLMAMAAPADCQSTAGQSSVNSQSATYLFADRRYHQPYGGRIGRGLIYAQEQYAADDYLPAVSQEGMYTWQAGKMPLKVWISNGSNVPGYRPQFRNFVVDGFDTWCARSQNKLAWQEVSDPKQADVQVGWTNDVTERPEGTEAGKTSCVTRLNTETGRGTIYSARMQFLTRLPERNFSDIEVAKTCMHEVGHALGLQGHSPYRGDIMYYAVSPTQQPGLSQRDINTLSALYASYPSLDSMAYQRVRPDRFAN